MHRGPPNALGPARTTNEPPPERIARPSGSVARQRVGVVDGDPTGVGGIDVVFDPGWDVDVRTGAQQSIGDHRFTVEHPHVVVMGTVRVSTESCSRRQAENSRDRGSVGPEHSVVHADRLTELLPRERGHLLVRHHRGGRRMLVHASMVQCRRSARQGRSPYDSVTPTSMWRSARSWVTRRVTPPCSAPRSGGAPRLGRSVRGWPVDPLGARIRWRQLTQITSLVASHPRAPSPDVVGGAKTTCPSGGAIPRQRDWELGDVSLETVGMEGFVHPDFAPVSEKLHQLMSKRSAGRGCGRCGLPPWRTGRRRVDGPPRRSRHAVGARDDGDELLHDQGSGRHGDPSPRRSRRPRVRRSGRRVLARVRERRQGPHHDPPSAHPSGCAAPHPAAGAVSGDDARLGRDGRRSSPTPSRSGRPGRGRATTPSRSVGWSAR